VMADFPRLPHLDAEALLEEVDVEGGAHIREVASRGQGALLLTGHFGNWEYLGALIPSLGGSLTVMGADQRNPLVGDLFEELRQRPGIETVSRERGLRALVKALRSGRLVASLADQDGGKGGFFLDFFGRPASVQGGLFRLAARLGVPMVTGFLWFEDGRWQARYDSPVETSPPGDEAAIEEEARRLALVYTRRLEQHIRAHPEQWFWVHRRWKTAPPGEAQRPGDVGR
jgi:KDO2-lipid IV(A) lauroyltransferase